MLLFLLCIGILPMHAAWYFCGKLPLKKREKMWQNTFCKRKEFYCMKRIRAAYLRPPVTPQQAEA